jgi:hypothetical protein
MRGCEGRVETIFIVCPRDMVGIVSPKCPDKGAGTE